LIVLIVTRRRQTRYQFSHAVADYIHIYNTVGTNHFGHFYLTDRLLPMVQRRIVVTASGVHDPASPGGAQGVPAGLGTLAGLAQDGKATEMMDGSPFNADKAYKDSKVSVSGQDR
jgi:NAD(P)-dependent dehydrogenase (short-subunit alcohol dehydrogenase family)